MASIRYIGLPALIARGMGALEDAVGEAAEDLQGRAQSAAPVDTGTLRGGIHVEGPRTGGSSVEATVSTGGESSEYSIPQHEGTSRGVPATKFLEGPLLEMAPVYRAYLERAMREAF